MSGSLCIHTLTCGWLTCNVVEFLVDDGTALVKAVLWSSLPWNKSVVLGDLVHVEGKLNMDKNWNDGVAP